jgi:hypothetical protein
MPHYSASKSHYEKCKQAQPNAPRIYYYHRTRSYVQAGFLKIWNDNTPAYNDLGTLVDRICFPQIYNIIDGDPISSRGNVHHAFGYSNLNITERDVDQFCRVPKLIRELELVTNDMVAVEIILGVINKAISFNSEVKPRMMHFASKIYLQFANTLR